MDIEELIRLFFYDAETGVLIWRVNTGKKRLIGSQAGTVRRDGYMRVGINKKDYYVHRIIWAMIYGKWPDLHIDHINGDPADNRISNLREATQSQNIANSKSKRLKGVCYTRGRYQAQIMVNYKYKFLGSFNTALEAKAAYDKAAMAYFGKYARSA